MAQSSKQRAEAEVLDLKGKLRQLNKAVAEKGATIEENAPLVATIKAVEGLKVGGEEVKLTIYKGRQFIGWKDKILPTLKISEEYHPADLSSTFEDCVNLVDIPRIEGLEEYAYDLTAMIKGCASLKSITLQGPIQADRMVSFASGCTELEKVNLDIACQASFDASRMFYGCSKLHTIAGVIDFSRAIKGGLDIGDIFGGCTSLREVRIKGLNVDLSLQDSEKLSVESVKYLVDNLQQSTGKSITLNQAWKTAHPNEAVEYSQQASAKGFTLNFI